MKKVITKRKNGTIRVQHECVGASKTDQSDKNYLDINNIMKKYAQTGLLPQFAEKVPQYIDQSLVPSYMEAHEQIKAAQEMFMQLPAEVRKLMDNKPENMVSVLSDSKNKEFLIKHGVMKKAEQVTSLEGESAQADKGAAVEKSAEAKK